MEGAVEDKQQPLGSDVRASSWLAEVYYRPDHLKTSGNMKQLWADPEQILPGNMKKRFARIGVSAMLR